MNHVLNRNLKACAVKLRSMVASGASEDEIQSAKSEMLADMLVSPYILFCKITSFSMYIYAKRNCFYKRIRNTTIIYKPCYNSR